MQSSPTALPDDKESNMSKLPSTESSSASSIFSSLCFTANLRSSSSRYLYSCSETMTPSNCFTWCLNVRAHGGQSTLTRQWARDRKQTRLISPFRCLGGFP